MPDLKPGQLFLGHVIDARTGAKTGADVIYDSRDLTTHGVIVGMTGSGKTGLGIVLIEEALLAGIPVLVLDPKGDMGNLCLNFPDLRPTDFAPWVNEGDARRAGLSVDAFAAQTSSTWRDGLADSGIDAERMRTLRDSTALTLYTPGSTAGVPLNIIGSLRAPRGDWSAEAEVVRDEIESFVSSLLGLAGIESDPLSSRDHILLSNLIEHAWSDGRDLDLPALIAQVQTPPLRKLGVFDLDAFFPARDRMALAIRLNGLVASPSFASWLQGPDLDIAAMLAPVNGKTRGAVIYLAHLSDDERLFVVTLILAKVITWMRGLSGTTDLRTLVYMDEVFGFAPPTAAPPSKKPILTLLKQGRAYGVGMVLSTQNPVDLDYKAVSNAGTWCIGRLTTERDKARMVEGLASARGDVDVPALDRTISALGKRQFLLQAASLKAPLVFASRWAISYLRGPLTREQVVTLTKDAPERVPFATGTVAPPSGSVASRVAPLPGGFTPGPVAPATPASALAGDESPVAPRVPSRVPVYFLDPAAGWAREVQAHPNGRRLQAGFVARVGLRFDDATAGIDHLEEWEAVFFPLGSRFDPTTARAVDYDPRDFRAEAPEGAVFALPGAALDKDAFFTDAERALKDHLYRNRAVDVFRNAALKLFGRVDETQDAFTARCQSAADDGADRETAALRARYEARIQRAQDALRTAQAQADQVAADVSARKQHELLSGAGDLLSAFLGGRGRTRSLVRTISRGSSRRSMTTRAEARKDAVEDKVAARQAEIDQLEVDLAEEIEGIARRWDEQAGAIDTVRIGLEQSDVVVQELAVVWVPVGG
jgi:hypothetical protein